MVFDTPPSAGLFSMRKPHDYIRTTVFVAPWTVLVPPNNLYNVANVNVPIDDTNTCFYFMAWGHPAQTPETETWRKFLGQRSVSIWTRTTAHCAITTTVFGKTGKR
jgi:hypothetical protein